VKVAVVVTRRVDDQVIDYRRIMDETYLDQFIDMEQLLPGAIEHIEIGDTQ
jgi:hypothetical protein